MAKEEKILGLGEISTIRDILMGNQINEFQQKFDEANQKTNDLESLVSGKLENLERTMLSKVSNLEKNMNHRLDLLESMLKDNVVDLENKISKTTKDDKQALGQMLQDMGGRLLTGS